MQGIVSIITSALPSANLKARANFFAAKIHTQLRGVVGFLTTHETFANISCSHAIIIIMHTVWCKSLMMEYFEEFDEICQSFPAKLFSINVLPLKPTIKNYSSKFCLSKFHVHMPLLSKFSLPKVCAVRYIASYV